MKGSRKHNTYFPLREQYRNMIKRGNSCKNTGTITTSRKGGVTFSRPIRNGGGGSDPVRMLYECVCIEGKE